MTTTARKMDLDQGNWRNFEERANLKFKVFLVRNKQTFKPKLGFKIAIIFF